MKPICLVDLHVGDPRGAILGGGLPEESPAYSRLLDVRFYRQDSGFQAEPPHQHSHGDEYWIVFQGEMELEIQGKRHRLAAGHLAGIRAGTPHRLLDARAPVECLGLWAPGGVGDSCNPEPAGGPGSAGILLDLHQDFKEYPLGACLAPDDPHYSPYLDFTCVWGADPAVQWRHEVRHVHVRREEYYFVLQGRLDFELDGSLQPVAQGQILGVRPPVWHRVAGGHGPVDVLFVRVPGGRGDKILG